MVQKYLKSLKRGNVKIVLVNLEMFKDLCFRIDKVSDFKKGIKFQFGLGIIGDPVYRPRRRPPIGPELGARLAAFDRIALHACRLGFEHPVTGERQRFERAPPPGFDRLAEALRAEVADSSLINHTGGKVRA